MTDEKWRKKRQISHLWQTPQNLFTMSRWCSSRLESHRFPPPSRRCPKHLRRFDNRGKGIEMAKNSLSVRAAACVSLLLPVFAASPSMASIEWPVASGGNGHFYEAVA